MRGLTVKKSGFTLLEVLIAAGILFIVGSATVGLTNSIIQGTNQTSSQTVANRLASEGLELVTKVRDDTVKNATGDLPWLAQAQSFNLYKWYVVTPAGSSIVDPITFVTNKVTLRNVVTSAGIDVKQTIGPQDYFRLICIEAVGAGKYTGPDNDEIGCNVTTGGVLVNDGSRDLSAWNGQSCITNDDKYCVMTKGSIERNRSGQHAIPPGNAVKVRSVVVWQDKDQYQAADAAILLTNWKSFIDAS